MAAKIRSRKYRRSRDNPPFMSSSTGLLAEELKCSVCLNVFTDPVSTPCGHNFCKSCLNHCWENIQNCYCPFCKETFSKKPDLKINTAFKQVAQLFEKKFSLSKSEVLCDVCDDSKLKALKSCLVCQTSYCETHLEPHQRALNLKKHKLMDPVENIKDYICQKHEKPLELFCRDDQMCVCVFCTDGDHKTHNTVPLEQESKEKKSQLMKTQKDVQKMIQDKNEKIQEIKHFTELRKIIFQASTEQEKAASVELFSDLMRSIERCQAELLEMMEEKQKAAEKQDEELIQELQQEITELNMRNTELDHLLRTEDHFQLLKIDPSLCSPPDTRNWPEISMNTDVSVETLRRALTQLQETLDGKLSQTVFRRIQQHAVDVTLDPDTAHPNLILSIDGKQVRHGDTVHGVPDYPERFDKCASVLGKEGFLSGRFYFEVQVKGKTKWDLGVARESINRKGKITVCPQNGYWTVGLWNENEYWACADSYVPLPLGGKLEKVGVFVDYEEGVVSFYDVESRSHIYSFTGQSFTNRLYPYFCPFSSDTGKNSAPLIILPVNYNTTQLVRTQKEVQQMIQDRIKKIQDIKHSAELRKKSTEQEKAADVELFSDLMHSIERCQAELLEMMVEKQKVAEKQDEELIEELQQEITELKMRNTELDHLLHTKDHLQLLQIDPSLYSPPDTKNWSEIRMNTDVSVETLRTALTQLQETLNEKLSQSVMRMMQQHTVDVTLDPDTAHPNLILSDDRKQVRHGDIKQQLTNNPERFDQSFCVLGKEGFSSRRFYFEVQVKGKTGWILGVIRESINRKGQILMSPQDGYWVVGLWNENEYWTCTDTYVLLSLRGKPQKVGVFVDYEEGLVSFYDVEYRSHIYSFTGQSFAEKLYPFFSPLPNDRRKNLAPLIISPGNCNK
ncbi:zinc finger protein RFP-like [Garra rufa]|uniref:zinc finger protein RFP-like n=1 Tax=Garra rufa TaxID=137080 RepID=UPI003CCE8C9E